jgi:hypothetical protein
MDSGSVIAMKVVERLVEDGLFREFIEPIGAVALSPRWAGFRQVVVDSNIYKLLLFE